jgi:CHAD domain-containing protein
VTAATTEEELKFRVRDTFAVPSLGGRGLRQIFDGVRTLDATYWDTPDLRLARRGHTLRYRTSDDGSENKWTLKLGGRRESPLLVRREVDSEGEPVSPPRALTDALVGITGGRELVAVAQLRSHQDRYRIEDELGHRILTMEDDRVQVIDRGRVVGSFREVEIELADPGSGREALDRAIRLLRDAGAGKPDPTSKLERALGPLAQHESAPALDRNSTIEQLVRFTVRQGLDQLLQHDPAVRLALGHEDVHQARVATRRLRANLRALRPLLARRTVDALRSEIAWAGCLLGEVRDLDVLRISFEEALNCEPGLEGGALLATIDVERAAAHRNLVDVMSTARWQSMLSALDTAAVLPPLTQTTAPTTEARGATRRLLRKSWRRLQRRVDAAHTTNAGWHEVRKAAKSTRYVAELLEPILGAKARRLARSTQRIQTKIGKDQDRIVARKWLKDHARDEQIGYIARRLEHRFVAAPDNQPRHWPRMWKLARRAAKPFV